MSYSDFVQTAFARPFFAGQSPTLEDLRSMTSHVGVVDGGQGVIESVVVVRFRSTVRLRSFTL